MVGQSQDVGQWCMSNGLQWHAHREGKRSMTITMIAALSRNHVIGCEGELPWRLPDDMARFMRLTRGHAVLMGRRTYDTLPGPLADRRNIVITRNPQWHAEGVEVAHSIEEALATVGDENMIYVLGGGELYRAMLPLADELDLTEVDVMIEGDTSFPEFDRDAWELVQEESHAADDRHAHAFTHRRFIRRIAGTDP